MKKFSTAALFLLIASTFQTAAAADTTPPATAATRCAFLPDAPDQHTVVRGDTLWGISGKFLERPWCWPQVWDMNREQIRNPHWIYPGQVVWLDRAAGRLRLGSPAGPGHDAGGLQTVRLSPQLRTEGVGQDAVQAIPASEIEPFLLQPLVVEENALREAPRIVATQETRVILGKGDKAYVRGDLKAGTSFQVFRPGIPLRDPVTKNILGYESAYLGTMRLERAARAEDEAHVFRVVEVKQEMAVGDRLLQLPPTPLLNYVPHPPETPVDARIVSVFGGVSQAGQNQVVTINRGKKDGIDVGTVLELSRFGGTVKDPEDRSWGSKKQIRLPDSQYGQLFVFRVFDGISYGLVMQVTDTVQIGDLARSPE